jgi:hypothetical protein
MKAYSAKYGNDNPKGRGRKLTINAADDKDAMHQAKQFVTEGFRKMTWITLTLQEADADYMVRMSTRSVK